MNKPENINSNYEPWRMWAFYLVLAGVFGYYIFRLLDLQIINGQFYLDQATENRVSVVSEPTNRGIIYDRNGFVLARNAAAYHVVITPADLPGDAGAVQEIYRQLSVLIDVPVNNGEINDETVKGFKPCDTEFGITQVVYIADTNAPYKPVRLKCNVDEKTALIVREHANDWKGVGIEVEPVRDYPTGELTSEVIGFLGPIPAVLEEDYRENGFVPGRDKVGYAGVEASLNDDYLMGKAGRRVIEVDVAGKEVRNLEDPIPAEPGLNVRLTIDTRLQSAAKAALKREMEAGNRLVGIQKYSNGAVIAMNPRTGEVLALVSYPTYENNRLARLIPAYYYRQLEADPHRPLFNHAISAEHPPGSVFKLAAAIGILNEGVVTPEQTVMDPGKITITEKFSPNDPGRPREYVCYTYKTTGGGHGLVDFLRGVAFSCDVYFYKVGGGYQDEVEQGLGIWRLGEYARALGYGRVSGIELPGEADGLIPDPNWKRVTVGENWSTGDTYIATIGQGYVLSTVIQVLISAATIANDGKMMQPTLVKEVLDAEGNVVRPLQTKQVWDFLKDPVINIYDENYLTTGEKKTVEPWVLQKVKEGMREVITLGTGEAIFRDFKIPSAGKTGTAEYCDNVAQAKNLCQPGNWPAHAWYIGYAPYDDPEIAVVAFVYNGDEGARLAAPVVREVMDAYFELKAIDTAARGTGGQ